MNLGEIVTFGGGKLDRRAEVRGHADKLKALEEDEKTANIVLWRGKVLVNGNSLARLPSSAGILAWAAEPAIFIGYDGATPVLAWDASDWIPPEGIPDTMGAFFDPSRQKVSDLGETFEFCELRAVMAELSLIDAEAAATARALTGWHQTHRFCSQCGANTVHGMAGWQRDCPTCGGHHFPRTDPVVIMLITKGNSLLLGRSHGWPEGMYSLLAGFVEPGESLESAVRREVYEESNIEVGEVVYLASQPWPFPTSLMVGCVGRALSTDIVVDPNELDDAIWIVREEMLTIVSGTHPKLSAPRLGSIARFIIERWLADSLDVMARHEILRA